MKNFPWKKLLIACAVITALVIAKGINTAIRTVYAGKANWIGAIFVDPWTYVGLAAAMVGAGAGIILLLGKKKPPRETQ